MAEIKPFTGVDNREILADKIPLSTPYTIGISPSNACNFKCDYCNVAQERQELTQSKFEKNQVQYFLGACVFIAVLFIVLAVCGII